MEEPTALVPARARPAACVSMCTAVVLTLGWASTAFFYVTVGDGRRYNVRVGQGTVVLNFGERLSAFEKVEFRKGVHVGALELRRLSFRLPSLWTLRNPFTIRAVMPLWIIVLPTIIMAMIIRAHGRRQNIGKCRGCNYDLTGNVSGRCPECGLDTTSKDGTQEAS